MTNAFNVPMGKESQGQGDVGNIQGGQDPAHPRLGDDQAQMKHAQGDEQHAELQYFGPKKGVGGGDVLAEMKGSEVPQRDGHSPHHVNAVQLRTIVPPQYQQRQKDIEQRCREPRDPDDIK